MADDLSRIKEAGLSDKEAKKVLKAIPVIPGDDTIFEVFEEKEKDRWPEKAVSHTMFSKAMKAVIDNLTSGAGMRAKLEDKADSAAHHKADCIKVSVWSMRLSTQMHVTDLAKAQCEDLEIEATMDWCHLDRRKSQPWTEQLAKFKSKLGTKKNTPEGRSILQNTDKLTLSGGLLY